MSRRILTKPGSRHRAWVFGHFAACSPSQRLTLADPWRLSTWAPSLSKTRSSALVITHCPVSNGCLVPFALVRPPGHHAEPARGMGFCVFNNAALAARTFSLETGGNALIADIDYHHGNGTQALVGGGLSYISTHASPEYPGTGDTGDNHVRSDGALANVPLPLSGIATEALVAIWTRTLRALARHVRPGLLIITAGFDFVAGDSIGDLGVAASAVRQIDRIAREIATEYCEGRALSPRTTRN
jgi:acetoin utilization deacetylase AcuC-like enzyme